MHLRKQLSVLISLRYFQRSNMPNITIDNQNYDLGPLSDEVKAQLASLQFADA